MKKLILSVALSVLFLFSFNPGDETFAQQRNPVLEEFTGTWCPWCPCGHTIMEDIVAAIPNAIMIGYHGPANGSDPFSFFSGNSVIGMLNPPFWPAGTADRTGAPDSRGLWMGQMTARNSVPATVAIDVSRTFNPTTREFSAIIDFTALTNLNGQYMFTVILLESGMIWNQTGNGSCPGGSNYVHNHVVRDMMNGATGEEVINGTWNVNDVITKTVNRTIPHPGGSGPDMVWDNCDIVVMVTESGSPLYNGEIQQAEEMTLISPDYVVTITSSNEDLIIESNGMAEFTAVVRNEGLLDDTYYVDVNMTAPTGWSAEFTTPNGTLPLGQRDSVDVLVGDTLAVDVSVLPNVLNGFGEVTVQFTSKNAPNIFDVATFRVVTTTGVPGLVIDASGEGYADLLSDAMDQEFEYLYGIVSREALYPGIDLTNYTMVCWSTGNAYPVFTVGEVDALKPFLDNGGRLLINGQNIGEDIFGASGQSQFAQSFYNDYLHASYVSDVGLAFFFKGINGDPISGQQNFPLNDLYPRSPDEFVPNDAFATSLFTFSNFSEYNSLRADDGTNRVVYLGFGLEQVAADSTRDTIATRSISWLMNGIVLNTPKEDMIATTFNLSQNYPNPFNPSTTINYSLATEEHVGLIVYDIMGREVAELVNEDQVAGTYTLDFDASSLASGMYFYKITAGNFVSTKKMVLLK